MARTVRVIAHGKAAADELLRAAVLAVRERGHSVGVRVTWEAGDAARFAREAVRDGVETVVAAGGDGTLHDVLQGLVADGPQRRTALGVIPMGTANDFASAAGLPAGDPVGALEFIAGGRPTLIDVGRVNGRYFVNVASGGFVTEVTASTSDEMKTVLGGAAYLLKGLFSVGSIQARPARLNAPAWEWEGNLYVLAVGNGRQAGGGFKLFERAALDDGLLDVLLIPEVPLDQLLGLFTLVTSGSLPEDHPHLTYRQVPRLAVEAPDGMRFNLDGEPYQGTSFRFEVVPRAVPFHLPAGAPLADGQSAPQGPNPP
jgi:lipid kinase YegS